MTGHPRFGRILEVGEHCLVGRALPHLTDFAATHLSAEMRLLPAELARIDPLAAIRNLRAGAYGLVIAHAPAYAGMRGRILRFAARQPWTRFPILALRSNIARLVPVHVPVVMIDLEDQPIIYLHNVALLDRAQLCFKREIPADRARLFLQPQAPALPEAGTRLAPTFAARLDKMRPISTGLFDEILNLAPRAPVGRQSDIFFAGSVEGSSSLRRTGAAELAQLAGRGVRVDMAAGRLPLAEFLARAATARMVWSPEGYAHDCFRHYETAACWSVPVINAAGIERYKPLLEGVHAHYYGVEPGGLTQAVLAALRRPERLEVMGRAAHRHALRHHTYAALTAYVLAEAEAELDRRAANRSVTG
jgi:hypothetical protein